MLAALLTELVTLGPSWPTHSTRAFAALHQHISYIARYTSAGPPWEVWLEECEWHKDTVHRARAHHLTLRTLPLTAVLLSAFLAMQASSCVAILRSGTTQA